MRWRAAKKYLKQVTYTDCTRDVDFCGVHYGFAFAIPGKFPSKRQQNKYNFSQGICSMCNHAVGGVCALMEEAHGY